MQPMIYVVPATYVGTSLASQFSRKYYLRIYIQYLIANVSEKVANWQYFLLENKVLS